MWIGIDDTDSRHGGCTTHLAGMIISSLHQYGLDLIGYPRLVRLNPNVPWKTRGNGAVSFQIGHGNGNSRLIGRMNGIDIFSYSHSKDISLNVSTVNYVKEEILRKIQALAQLKEKHTNPGVVIVFDQIKEELYWNAVRKILDKDEMISCISQKNGWFHEFNNGRGIIGATAGIAWKGNHDNTYELITYRSENNWGTKRTFDKNSVLQMNGNCVSTFDNYDKINDQVNIFPNSPCPVLFGIRGDSADELLECMSWVKTESFKDWLIFASNQGTDDHLVSTSIRSIEPFQSIICTGKVSKKPITIQGGHVIFSLCDNTIDCIDCAAYEPTKQFRKIIRKLEIGDLVTVYGGVRKEPFTVNLEKIEIKQLVDVYMKIENPICPVCSKHMKSKGKGQGYVCKKCKTKSRKAVFKKKKREIQEKMYEVPICARRHLSKPLKRMSAN